MHGRPRAQNRAAPLRTPSGLATRFCTPYEVSDAAERSMERDASSFRRVCNGAMHGRPRAQNRAAPLRTPSGLATRFCTPYEVSDAVVLSRQARRLAGQPRVEREEAQSE